MDTSALKRLPPTELLALADSLELNGTSGAAKQELILGISRALLSRGEELRADGTLEILPEGYAFLRTPEWSYLAGPDDVYISPSQIKRFGLRTGDTVVGLVRPPKPWERYLSMARLEQLNGADIETAQQRGEFETLRARYPDERLRLESKSGGLSMRVVDLFAPIGKGQRGLIVAPPRAGKTILLQQIANSIVENHPEVFLIILLIDERPEEVTDMRASVPSAEVISSTFDEVAARHVLVTEMVGEKAKRLVEAGRDVVILLDSITRMARAHNTVLPNNGRILSGGVDARAMAKPKRFFGAARKIDGGGSLSIIGTALVDTGSRMDEVIFEEFKGTGNMELVLSRDLANKRIWPAIDIFKSGTRKEELLLSQEEMNRTHLLRTYLSGMPEEEAMPFLLRHMAGTATNKEFFRAMAEGA
ncbi:MAG TPA: transcription termination factor Rho [Gemmatimonadaceae bacterium]|nr:transcription termination factor Rho [Gemmatimonadaceae bacterium]